MGRLILEAVDNIQGGSLNYDVEGDTLNVQGSGTAKLGWFSHTEDVSFSFVGTPGQFKKKNWTTPGQVQTFPHGVMLSTRSCDGTTAQVVVSSPEFSLDGVAAIDVSGDPEATAVILRVDGQLKLPIIGTNRFSAIAG